MEYLAYKYMEWVENTLPGNWTGAIICIIISIGILMLLDAITKKDNNTN